MAKSKPTAVSSLGEGGQRPSGVRRAVGGPVQFFRETFWELKRVRWPNRREVVNYTAAALITSAVIGVAVVAFDFGVAKVMSLIGLV